MEKCEYAGWSNCVRLTNGEVELIITTDIGPRIIRFGFVGQRNMFVEMKDQLGKSGEKQWMIRGGHRFWIAPEEKPKTYELDNSPIEAREIRNGVHTLQPTGSLSGIQREMQITLSPRKNAVKIVHTLTNKGNKAVTLSPWALSAMAQNGTAIIPQPKKIPHTKRLTHTHEWSLWGYTDLSDPRWTLGSNYLLLRQDPKRTPNKIGILHRQGWVAYHLDGFLFVKKFKAVEGKTYPDGNVNFETFTNEDFLELESLGYLTTLKPGESVDHEEEWSLFKGVKACKTEEEIDAVVAPLTRL